MKYLVIGAGYLGSAFLSQGAQLKEDLIATTTSVQNKENLLKMAGLVEIFRHPDPDQLKALVELSDVICVFVAPKEEGYSLYLDLVRDLSSILLFSQKKHYVVYVSSTFVYEGLSLPIVSEDTPLDPKHTKAKALLEAEKGLLSLSSDKISICVLRLAGIFGPNRELTKRASLLSSKVLAGTGLEPTNHIHVEDAAGFAWHCIKKSLVGIYNVVMPQHPKRVDLYQHLCSQLSIPPPTFSPEKTVEHGCGAVVSSQKMQEARYSLKHTSLW